VELPPRHPSGRGHSSRRVLLADVRHSPGGFHPPPVMSLRCTAWIHRATGQGAVNFSPGLSSMDASVVEPLH
jgi:hypothetical protein